jgi:hypothetical protein
VTDAAYRHLPVDLTELCIALKTEASELRWYLDVTTGELLLVTHEYEPDDHGGLSAVEIRSTPSRFVEVPRAAEDEGLGDMQAFVAEVKDPRLKESLELALTGLRPERRFRAALNWIPGLVDHWRAFSQGRLEARALTWLHSLGYMLGTPRGPGL